MEEDGYELELGSANGGREGQRRLIDEIKTSDLPFTSEVHQKEWSEKRFLGALIGKSARAARGAYEYTTSTKPNAGLGYLVESLEGEE